MINQLDKMFLLWQDLALMTIQNSTLFISDLHLDPQETATTNTFFYFLEHIAPAADALYILGDLFESYVGDDDYDLFKESIIRVLAKLTNHGVPVYVMLGNRDFLIGKKFAQRAGITLIPDPFVITLNNQRILLMHGDSLCTDDKSHQRYRKITRNSVVQKIFLTLPLFFRQKLAKQLREESQRYNQAKSKKIMDVNQDAVNCALEKNNAMRLIHGHTHKPLLSEKRIVLDAWHNHGNYLQVNQDGTMALITIPF